MSAADPLLSVSLSADYPAKSDVLNDVRFCLQAGEIFGLVGQSGSGKSTLALALLGLLSSRGGRVRGSIAFRGRELTGERESQLRKIRGREIAFVPQSPLAALNPVLRLRSQFREVWLAHGNGPMDSAMLPRLMQSVSLPLDPAFLERYPAELSVGQAQRVLIAMALLHGPALLIADEPTSALDVITQAEILALFRKLNSDLGTAIIFISHDLLSVAAVCHRIGILRDGVMVECGDARQVLCEPRHEYAKRLVASAPRTPWSAVLETAF